MAIRTDDMVNMEFSRAFLGYDIREVDEYLDTLIDRFEKQEAQRKQLLSAMEALLKRLEETDDLSEDMKRTVANGAKALRRLCASEPAASAAGARSRKSAGTSRREPEYRRASHKRAAISAAEEETTGNAGSKPAEAPDTGRLRNGTVDRIAGSSARAAVRVGRGKVEETVLPGTETHRKQVRSEADTAGDSHTAAMDAAPAAIGGEPNVGGHTADVDALIPELLSDLESALADGAIRSASSTQKDVDRAADGESAL